MIRAGAGRTRYYPRALVATCAQAWSHSGQSMQSAVGPWSYQRLFVLSDHCQLWDKEHMPLASNWLRSDVESLESGLQFNGAKRRPFFLVWNKMKHSVSKETPTEGHVAACQYHCRERTHVVQGSVRLCKHVQYRNALQDCLPSQSI